MAHLLSLAFPDGDFYQCHVLLLFMFRALFILLYTALKAQSACFFVLKCFTSQSTISFMSARCHRFLDITSTFRGVNASLLKDTTQRG